MKKVIFYPKNHKQTHLKYKLFYIKISLTKINSNKTRVYLFQFLKKKIIKPNFYI